MLVRTQRRIIMFLFLLIFGGVGYYLYFNVINKADSMPKSNQMVENIAYYQSNNLALFSISWKEQMKASSVKNKDNYLVEQVVPQGKKWMTVVNGKKCKINLVQHIEAPFKKKGDSKDNNNKVTQLSVYVDPKEDVDDYFRIRVKNAETKAGEKMSNVDYGVIQITEFHKFIKK